MKSPYDKGRNIRLDIFAREKNGRCFDCEVQKSNTGAVPKRARFHSAMLDTRMLKEGQAFDSLKDSYVIFITKEDYFNDNEPIYYVERKVNEQRSFADGNHILYINGAYKGDDPLGKLIQDMNNTGTNGFNYKELEDGVRHFKMDKEEHDNMSDSIEKFARDVAEDYAKEKLEERETDIISKLLRKGKDAEEVADLLDLDIERVKSVEEGMLVNS